MFVGCLRLLPRIGSVWMALLFLLIMFSPGLSFHCSSNTVCVSWGEALAESKPKAIDETFLTLPLAIERALAGNPGLGEIKARAEAMAAIPSQAGSLSDPTVNFGLLNLPTRSFNLRDEDMTMVEMGVSQMIPFPGKLALREKIAEQEALAATDSVDEARLRLVREVKQGWWRLFYYDRALNLLDEAENFFQQLIDIAQAKYKVGTGAQQDVLLAQLELSKLKSEKLELVSLRHTQNTVINALLDIAVETPAKIPIEAEFKLPVLVEAVLQDKALKVRPLFA